MEITSAVSNSLNMPATPIGSRSVERAGVEQPRLHLALLSQMVDDHVQELDLIGGQNAFRDEVGERSLRCLAIKANQ